MQIVRTLRLGAKPNTTRVYKPNKVVSGSAQVVVKTSDVKGAGTDANVYLTLFGEQEGKPANSGPQRLENNANNFERGMADIFELEAAVGELRYIKIGHDNTGLGPSWHLQEVLVSSPGMPDKQFVANRWLATGEGDGQTYCVLYPDGEGTKPELHKYRVEVFTSDIRGAGTDARVSITMFGANGLDTGKLLLENSRNNFERGQLYSAVKQVWTENLLTTPPMQMDVFFITFANLGPVTAVEIEHDNSGAAPGWHCEQVVVVDETANARYAFPCDRWLAKDEDDGLIRRRLQAAAASDTTSYRVITYTSDIRLHPSSSSSSSGNNSSNSSSSSSSSSSSGNNSSNSSSSSSSSGNNSSNSSSSSSSGNNSSNRSSMWRTAECRGAGTDAMVYVELCGTKPGGVEAWGLRHILDSQANNFERAQVRGQV
ncbi:hypothetical protein QJQ45_025481 [Haematococcus lacustris]|nr:hypothetical protein QJQ45_025481 [Haematococcus lacustris]